MNYTLEFLTPLARCPVFHLTADYGVNLCPHSSTLAWKIPWMEEPGRLQSMGSRRVGHDWATSLSLFTFMHWRRKWQPTAVFFPGESQGRGSLVGCCLWGGTESDTTEATRQQQQQVMRCSASFLLWCQALLLLRSLPISILYTTLRYLPLCQVPCWLMRKPRETGSDSCHWCEPSLGHGQERLCLKVRAWVRCFKFNPQLYHVSSFQWVLVSSFVKWGW